MDILTPITDQIDDVEALIDITIVVVNESEFRRHNKIIT